MLKVSRLADYATMIMSILASRQMERCSAAEIARLTPISMATVSKVLKLLNESKLVNSERGVNGGYRLAKAPESISVAEIVTAIDGRPAMTECSRGESQCEHDAICSLRNNWRFINTKMFELLDNLSLANMRKPLSKFED